MKRDRSLPKYVYRRPNTSYLWFQKSVPVAVRGRIGQSVVQFSLETADIRLAEVLAGEANAKLMREWGLVEDPVNGLSAAYVPSLEELATTIGYTKTTEIVSADAAKWPDDAAIYKTKLERLEGWLLKLTARYQSRNFDAWRTIADTHLERHGLKDRVSGTQYDHFVDLLAQSTIEAMKVQLSRARGELDAEPTNFNVKEALSRSGKRAKKGEQLLDLFDKWSAEVLAKGEKRPDTVEQDRKIISQFSDFVGPDRMVSSITPKDVIEYRDTLRDLPPRWQFQKTLLKLTMREAAKVARELKLPTTKFTTVNKHLSTISPLFKWLAGRPEWAGLSNPCSGLFHKNVKGKNPRPPFSTEDLNRIISSPLFTGFKGDGQEHLIGMHQADDWRKWIPLVCLFTGTRIGEVAQLMTQDVLNEHGVWCLRITEDPANGQQTKNRMTRFAVVHQRLIEIGFIGYVETRKAGLKVGQNASLFAGFAASARGQIGAVPSRFWRDYLGRIGFKNDGDGFGAHSFRHTFADRLRSEANLLDEQVGICLGHQVKTVTSGYGRLQQGTLKMLAEWINAVTFKGVDFGHLMPATASSD